MPWSMHTVVALVVLQRQRRGLPAEIDGGDALSVAVGGTGPSAAIGHSRPLIPGRVVGVHDGGGRGNTSASVW